CVDCTSAALAIQTVVIVGNAHVVLPENTAVSYNQSCVRCHTFADADQLIVQMDQAPPEALRQQVMALSSRLGALAQQLDASNLDTVPAAMGAIESAVSAVFGPSASSIHHHDAHDGASVAPTTGATPTTKATPTTTGTPTTEATQTTTAPPATGPTDESTTTTTTA